MDISIVIPNYNGENLLRKNLSTIFSIVSSYKNGKSEIIITDDSSDDASLDVVREFIKKNNTIKIPIVLLENTSGKNKGFATNVNKGVDKASGEIVILLNTDVVPQKNFLMPLLAHFNNASVFAVGCMDESVENEKTILRGRGIGKWYHGFLIHSRGEINHTSTLWVSCGSGAFRKSMWDKLGGLLELYNPFYWEDIDISYRAQKAGFIVLFEKNSVVQHEHEKGSIKKHYTKQAIKQISYRNQIFFTWINATDTMLIVQNVFYVFLVLLKALVSGDSPFIFGFFSTLVSLPKVLQARKTVQKEVKKSDREVIQMLEK